MMASRPRPIETQNGSIQYLTGFEDDEREILRMTGRRGGTASAQRFKYEFSREEMVE